MSAMPRWQPDSIYPRLDSAELAQDEQRIRAFEELTGQSVGKLARARPAVGAANGPGATAGEEQP